MPEDDLLQQQRGILKAFREASAARRRRVIGVALGVGLVLIAAISWAAYQGVRAGQKERLYQTAGVALSVQQWGQARAVLEQLLAIDRTYKDAPTLLRESYYRPAAVAMEAGQWEEARRHLEPLLQLDSAYKDAPTLLRESYSRPALAAIEASGGKRERDGMPMGRVPAGEFLMGSPDGEGVAAEHPQHTVYLDAFWIDETEVTNAQYGECAQSGACQPAGCSDNSDLNTPQQPVVCVDWSQADAYCNWAGARLPTEAEWEKAACGNDGRTYPWGNGDPTCERANTSGCVGKAAPVGSCPAGAGPHGALDMAGNVWEWVADWYADDTYVRSPQQNPTGPESGDTRVLRGGSWGGDRGLARCGYRYRGSPAARNHIYGFRCCVSSTSSL